MSIPGKDVQSVLHLATSYVRRLQQWPGVCIEGKSFLPAYKSQSMSAKRREEKKKKALVRQRLWILSGAHHQMRDFYQ